MPHVAKYGQNEPILMAILPATRNDRQMPQPISTACPNLSQVVNYRSRLITPNIARQKLCAAWGRGSADCGLRHPCQSPNRGARSPSLGRAPPQVKPKTKPKALKGRASRIGAQDGSSAPIGAQDQMCPGEDLGVARSIFRLRGFRRTRRNHFLRGQKFQRLGLPGFPHGALCTR